MDHRSIKTQNNFDFHIQTLRFLALRTIVRFAPVRSFLAKIIVLLRFKKLLIAGIFFFLFSFSQANAFLGIDFSF